MSITNEQRNELNMLIGKIRQNKAKESDYEKYEQILTLNGVPKEKIKEKMLMAQVYDYDDFIQERIKAENDLPRRQIFQTVVVAGIVALGLSILINAFKRED